MAPEIAPLVVIVGPTASGKTALALDIAERFNGEIICADSRTVYKGMDIGTAKPTPEEQAQVQHHLIDVVEPDELFSAAKFKVLAKKAIIDIGSRGKLPIMVGGTGLYVDSVLFDFQFLPPADPDERARLDNMTVEQLQKEIMDKNLPMPENRQNSRHLARVIEVNGAIGQKSELRSNTLVLGIDPGLEIIKQRIVDRVEMMVQDGFIEETKQISAKYGWDAPGLLSTGYKAFRGYIEDKMSLEEAKAQFVRNDYLLARRQRTWFRRPVYRNFTESESASSAKIGSQSPVVGQATTGSRHAILAQKSPTQDRQNSDKQVVRNKSIQWVDNRETAVAIVTTFLNKKQ